MRLMQGIWPKCLVTIFINMKRVHTTSFVFIANSDFHMPRSEYISTNFQHIRPQSTSYFALRERVLNFVSELKVTTLLQNLSQVIGEAYRASIGIQNP